MKLIKKLPELFHYSSSNEALLIGLHRAGIGLVRGALKALSYCIFTPRALRS